MQKAWNWSKENAGTLAALGGVLLGVIGIVQFGVLNPIHQRFDAIDRRFDAQDSRDLDDLKAEMNQRFDTQDKHINQRFDAQDKYINQRFDAMDQRFDRLENDVSELRNLSDRVSHNEGQIDVIRQQLQTADTPSP